MPAGGPLGRSISSSQGAFTTPIVTNNPVFQVKLLSVDDKMEQKGGDSKKMQDTIKRGDKIIGKAMGDSGKKKYKGVVQNILKDSNGNELSYVITDEDGNQIKIDPSTATFLDLHDTGREAGSAERNRVTESNHVMLFEDWKASRS
jgi:hypothetical protein